MGVATMKALMLLILLAVTATNTLANEQKPAETDQSPASGVVAKKAVLPSNEATEIRVIVEKKQTIEEYRHRGQLILVKVIPNKGKPYFIDPLENKQLGSGKELMDAGVKPVHWVIKEF